MTDFGKEQLDNIKKAGSTGSDADLSTMMGNIQNTLHTARANMYSIKLGGTDLPNTEIYKSYMPVFREIYEKLQPAALTNVVNILIASMTSNTSGQAPELTMRGMLNFFSQTVDAKTNEEIAKAVFIPNDETNKILKGLRDYEAMSNLNYSNENQIAKKAVAMELYKNAFELYSKILMDAYSKLTNTSLSALQKGQKNAEMREFFKKDYPTIMDSVDNVLRNDAGHLNYNERDKYTAEQLMEMSNTLISGLFTALIAKCDNMVGLFDTTLSTLGISKAAEPF